ncbi:hypothetical protein KUCAC02_034533, partial [Chaenocephalus aceratus]
RHRERSSSRLLSHGCGLRQQLAPPLAANWRHYRGWNDSRQEKFKNRLVFCARPE